MEIYVNGVPKMFDGRCLMGLIEAEAPQKPFAVAVNTVFVSKSQHDGYVLQDADRVEIVRPVVGG